MSKMTMMSEWKYMITNGQDNSSRVKSRQQRRSGRTREKLLTAARSVFAEKGLNAATIDDITEMADVGRGSFYYYFDDKDTIVLEMVDNMLSELAEQMEKECHGSETLEEILDGMIATHIRFFSTRWKDFVLYYQTGADLTLDYSNKDLETPFLTYLKRIEKLLDDIIPAAITDEKLRRLACAIAGFVSGYYSFASVASIEQDVDKEFMSLRKMFVTSLAQFTRDSFPDSGHKW